MTRFDEAAVRLSIVPRPENIYDIALNRLNHFFFKLQTQIYLITPFAMAPYPMKMCQPFIPFIYLHSSNHQFNCDRTLHSPVASFLLAIYRLNSILRILFNVNTLAKHVINKTLNCALKTCKLNLISFYYQRVFQLVNSSTTL